MRILLWLLPLAGAARLRRSLAVTSVDLLVVDAEGGHRLVSTLNGSTTRISYDGSIEALTLQASNDAAVSMNFQVTASDGRNVLTKSEGRAPYTACGDNPTKGYSPCGNLFSYNEEYTVVVTPFVLQGGKSTKAEAYKVSFTLVPPVSDPVNVVRPAPDTFVSFHLIQTPDNVPVVRQIKNGDIISLSSLGITASPSFNLEAEPLDGNIVKKVRFSDSNGNFGSKRTEGSAPFSFCGDQNKVFNTCPDISGLGSYTIQVNVYDASGTKLGTQSLRFSITNGGSSTPSNPIVPVPVEEDRKWKLVRTTFDDMTARHEACFVTVGRKSYLIGGRGKFPTDIYDLDTGAWTHGPAPPLQLHHMQCVVVGTDVWIVAAWTGGYPREKTLDTSYVYRTTSNSWTTATALPPGRRRGSAAVVYDSTNHRIYVSHGNQGGHKTDFWDDAKSVAMLDYYDIAEDKWTALADADVPRDHTGGALINSRYFCVTGGRNGGLDDWPSVGETECFDIINQTWSLKADIPVQRSGSSYGTTCDGKLMIAGGEGLNKVFDDVEVFDGDTWTTLPGLENARHGSSIVMDCKCNRAIIAGGSGGPKAKPLLNSIEIFSNGDSCA